MTTSPPGRCVPAARPARQGHGRYDTAIKLALKAYQVNPRDAITLGTLALYYAKKGDFSRAQNFIAARDIDANNNVLIYNDALTTRRSPARPPMR